MKIKKQELIIKLQEAERKLGIANGTIYKQMKYIKMLNEVIDTRERDIKTLEALYINEVIK